MLGWIVLCSACNNCILEDLINVLFSSAASLYCILASMRLYERYNQSIYYIGLNLRKKREGHKQNFGSGGGLEPPTRGL